MKKTFKKGLIFILFIILFINIFSINVQAEEKEYYIDSAFFDVYLKENGDAEITETWYVNYVRGEFSRFYKNIYLKLPKEEKYTNIKDFEAYIDNVQCTFTDDVDSRPDYHFNVSKSGDTLTYSLFKKSENINRQFRVKYTLENVVKYIKNDDSYMFIYRFLPKGYKQNIQTLDINIRTAHPNDDIQMEVISSPGSVSSDGKTLNITDYNASDLFKVKVKMNGSYFKNISHNSEINTSMPSILDISNINKEFLLFLFCALLSLVAILLNSICLSKSERFYSNGTILICSFIPMANIVMAITVLFNIKNKVKIRKIMQENPNYLNVLAKKWNEKGINPIHIIGKISPNKYLTLFMYIAILTNDKIIQFSRDYQYIAYPVDIPEKSMKHIIVVHRILEKIRVYCEELGLKATQKNRMWIIPLSYIEEYTKNFDAYIDTMTELNTITDDIIYKTRDFQKDLAFIKDALNYIPIRTITFEELLNCYQLDMMSGNIYNLLNFVRQEDVHINMGMKTTINSFNITYLAISQYALYVAECSRRKLNPATGLSYSSSSGCSSGCSSCSSCSGCGGCGGSD